MIGMKPSIYLLFFVLHIALVKPPLSFCVGTINSPIGEVVVYATDPRIHYNPPLNDASGVWSPLLDESLGRNASQTAGPNASVSLDFQGTSLKLYVILTPGTPRLNVTPDGVPIQAAGVDSDGNIGIMSVDYPGVDTGNHTVVVQKSADSSNDSSWNILAFGFSDPSPSPTSNLPIVSLTAGVSASSQAEGDPKPVNGGAIAGTVVAILCGIGFTGGLVLCLRRRKGMITNITPEPWTMTAPPPVWPSSIARTSTLDQYARLNATNIASFDSPMLGGRARTLSDLNSARLPFWRRFSSGSSNRATVNPTELDSDIRSFGRQQANELATECTEMWSIHRMTH